MARDVSDATAIESRDELVAWIAAGEKPAEDWRIGTEHEKIPFYRADCAPVPYAGDRGIRALLDGLAALDGWEPIVEDDHPIGLADTRGGGGTTGAGNGVAEGTRTGADEGATGGTASGPGGSAAARQAGNTEYEQGREDERAAERETRR